LALARSRPSLVRLRINSRSNSARPPKTPRWTAPFGVPQNTALSEAAFSDTLTWFSDGEHIAFQPRPGFRIQIA
jgi:hypothetical protein